MCYRLAALQSKGRTWSFYSAKVLMQSSMQWGFGTLEPRKNIGGLLDAFEWMLETVSHRSASEGGNGVPELVLAGRATDEAGAWLERIARPPLAGRVRHIGYVDPALGTRVGMCRQHGCAVSLGGTLLEVAAMQDRVGELRDWAGGIGITHIEVSNGLRAFSWLELNSP